MEKLPISAVILAWHSGQTLVNTLKTYVDNKLYNSIEEFIFVFQEATAEDNEIFTWFSEAGIKCQALMLEENVGIGQGFLTGVEKATSEFVLILEHDWHLIEPDNITNKRLKTGINHLDRGANVVRYRHRRNPGYPLFTENVYKGNELNHYDAEIDMISPHLLDSIHWLENPARHFPRQIKREGDYYIAKSRWANWTNNPILMFSDEYEQIVRPFSGKGIDLEGKIGYWWARQDFTVVQGDGLFSHVDGKKYHR